MKVFGRLWSIADLAVWPSRGLLATPGGLVEKKDAVDPQGIMQTSIMFRRGLQREVLEETDIDIDPIDPSDVFELPACSGQLATHKNFGVMLKTSVMYARPQHRNEWEMTAGGVDGIGSPIPGGFHSWMSLSRLLQRSDVMDECRYAIEMCIKILNVEALASSLPASSSRSDSVFAQVGVWQNDARDMLACVYIHVHSKGTGLQTI